MPHIRLPRARLGTVTAVDVAVECGAAASRSDARKLLRSGGFYINNKRYADCSVADGRAAVDTVVTALEDTVTVLRRGRRTCSAVWWD